MRIDKKIKKYADSKMEQFKDTEFLNSICDAHFNASSKPRYNRKAVVSVVASLVILLTITLTVSLTIQYTAQHYTAQYITTPSNIQELNGSCKYFTFAENEPYSVNLTTNRDSKETVYYDVNYLLNNGADSFSLLIVINDKNDVEFFEYDKYKHYGNFNVNYTIINEYDENDNVLSSMVLANIFTDYEKIKIKYVGVNIDDDAFFDTLSTLLFIKE